MINHSPPNAYTWSIAPDLDPDTFFPNSKHVLSPFKTHLSVPVHISHLERRNRYTRANPEPFTPARFLHEFASALLHRGQTPDRNQLLPPRLHPRPTVISERQIPHQEPQRRDRDDPDGVVPCPSRGRTARVVFPGASRLSGVGRLRLV